MWLDLAEVDVGEVLGCTCLQLQRTTRRVTQIYDRWLAPVGITTNQFGLLANLVGMRSKGVHAPRLGAFAERMGMDPTTLTRNLKPLESAGLIAVGREVGDRRVRTMRITDAGHAKLREAVPLWRQSQAQVEGAVGPEAKLALNGLLALLFDRLEEH